MKNFKEKCITVIFCIVIAANCGVISVKLFDNGEQIYKNIRRTAGYQNRVTTARSQIELYTTDKLSKRMTYIEANAFALKIFNRNYFLTGGKNVRLKKNDAFATLYSDNRRNIKKFAGKIAEFKEYNDSLGINTLYIQAPNKIQEGNEQLPDGVVEFANKNMTEMVSGLEEKNVDVLDLRDKMKESSLDYYQSFFKTDTHWRIDTALWATKVIADYTYKEYSMPFDTSLLDRSKFKEERHENAFLGVIGRKLSKVISPPEDFTFLYPAYKSKIHIQIPRSNVDQVGTFDEVLIKKIPQSKDADPYTTPFYERYLHGNKPFTKIENLTTKNDYKVLWIGESWSLPVVSFLSLDVDMIHYLDLRTNRGSVKKYIENLQPDLVVIMYNASSLYDSKMYTFK